MCVLQYKHTHAHMYDFKVSEISCDMMNDVIKYGLNILRLVANLNKIDVLFF